MNLRDVGRLIYRDDLNRTGYTHPDAVEFIRQRGKAAGRAFLDFVVLDVIGVGEWEKVNISYCIASYHAVSRFVDPSSKWGTSLVGHGNLYTLVFVSGGKVEKFVLNPDSDFFSDMHRNNSKMTRITHVKKVRLDPRRRDQLIHFGGKRRAYVSNYIDAGILLPRPLEKYEGYKEYLDYDPKKFSF